MPNRPAAARGAAPADSRTRHHSAERAQGGTAPRDAVPDDDAPAGFPRDVAARLDDRQDGNPQADDRQDGTPTDVAPPDDPADGFGPRVVAWQRRHGRHALPWQQDRDPYRIWLSEIMLQQTQVATVIPYFEAFTAAFPTVQALADAPEEAVMARWAGLGYYSRARNLHRCAQHLVEAHGGRFPSDREALQALPGIGRTTAAAIAVFAFGRREAILDGNVKRVLGRHEAIEGFPGAPAVERQLWARAQALLPSRGLRAYTQGLMDLGATVCLRTAPRCGQCPVAGTCGARRENRQHLLPAPRPRRQVPQRAAAVLVVLRAGASGTEVWLPRREGPGVWAGLRSLPELPLEADVAPAPSPGRADATAHDEPSGSPSQALADWARGVLAQACPGVEGAGALVVRRARPLAPVDHAFTHFRLRLYPWLIETPVGLAAPGAPDPAWPGLAALDDIALPAPIRRLLQGLDERDAGAVG